MLLHSANRSIGCLPVTSATVTAGPPRFPGEALLIEK
jgi:hypothetical protein